MPDLEPILKKNRPGGLKAALLTLALLNAAVLSLVAQTNEVATTPAMVPNVNLWSLFSAWFMTVLNNPASMMLVGDLIVLGCLLDSFRWYPSDRVMHACVIMGSSTYWLFAFPSTVPPCFPHAQPVFFSNGLVCGFTAYLVHRQIVARLIRKLRGLIGEPNPPETP